MKKYSKKAMKKKNWYILKEIIQKEALKIVGLSLTIPCFLLAAGCVDTLKTSSLNFKKNQPVNVTVGLLSCSTGIAAQYGTSSENGAILYINEFNEKQKDIHVDYLKYDDQMDAAKSVLGVDNLYDNEVAGIVASTVTTPAVAIAPKANQLNLPMVISMATGKEITYDTVNNATYNNMFRACLLDESQGEKMAEFCHDSLGAKSASIMYCSESDYSTNVERGFKNKLNELKMDIKSEDGFPASTVDFNSYISKIASKKPDVLFIPYHFNAVSLIAPLVRNAGLDIPLIGSDSWDSILSVFKDPSLIEGSYYCSDYLQTNKGKVPEEFLISYKNAYNQEANAFAAKGYDAAKILLGGIQSAINTKTNVKNIEQFRADIISQLAKTDLDGATGHIKFDEFHNPLKKLFIMKIQNSQAELFQES